MPARAPLLRVGWVLLLVLAPGASSAQLDADDPNGAFHTVVSDRLAEHNRGVHEGIARLQRETWVLGKLTQAGAALLSPQTERAHADAAKLVAEAREAAEREPALDRPVFDVFERVDDVLAQRFPEPPERTRARFFTAVLPLEEHLIERCDAAMRERDEHDELAIQIQAQSHDMLLATKMALRALSTMHREALRTP